MPEALNTTFEAIAEIVLSHSRFALVSHVRPDGDAIGSQLGLADALQGLGKEVILLNEDGVPESLAFLPGSETIRRSTGEAVDVEVVFALDTATKPRLGDKTNQSLAQVGLWVNVDHHITNPRYGSLNYINPKAPATGEILYDLIESQGWPLSRSGAVSLYAAISTDTGSFQYAGTTERTYLIGAALVARGVNVGQVNQQLYETYPYRRIQLLRELLNVLKISNNGKVASWQLTQEMVQRLGLLPDDSEGLIDVIRAIDTVEVAVFFEELTDGKIRISSRSKSPSVDVGKICGHFGGGGHVLAAGARMAGNIKLVEERFLEQVYHALAGNA